VDAASTFSRSIFLHAKPRRNSSATGSAPNSTESSHPASGSPDIKATQVDPDVAKLQEAFVGLAFDEGWTHQIELIEKYLVQTA